MTRGQVSRRKDARVRSVRRLTAGFLHHRAPVWSPDGRMLGFTLGRGPDSHWLLTDRKGRAVRVLPGPVVGGASLAPDHSVAYGRQVGATAEIWVVPALDAAPQRLLGGDGRLYRDPAFSPDGRFLCYAADDGPAGNESPLRLWVVELTRLEHTLLVAEPPAIAGASGLIRAGHPAWSPASDCIFFDVTQGEHSAVAMVTVESRTTQLLTGPGFCCPAPIAPGLLCVERSAPDQLGEICLLQYRVPRLPTDRSATLSPAEELGSFKVRTSALPGVAPGAREPAVVVSKKGTVRLAWIAPGSLKGGEPQRYDVHTGQLVRLPFGRALRATRGQADHEPIAEVAADEDGDLIRQQSAVVSAGLSAKVKNHDKAKAKRGTRAAHRARERDKALARSERGGLEGAAGDEAPADAERGV